MYCNNCGAQIADGLAYCSNCGASQQVQQGMNSQGAPFVQQNQSAQYAQPQGAPFMQQNQGVQYAQPQSAQFVQQPQGAQYANQQQYAGQQYTTRQYGNQQYANQQYAPPQGAQYANPQYAGQQQYQAPGAWQTIPASPSYVGFGQAVKLFFKNYANFKTRSTKSEYWWAYLFVSLVNSALGILSLIPVIGFMFSLGALAILLPSISLTVRRLHDIGRRWPYIFMGFIPFAGAIILIVQCCKPSDGNNQWGPAPYRSR